MNTVKCNIYLNLVFIVVEVCVHCRIMINGTLSVVDLSSLSCFTTIIHIFCGRYVIKINAGDILECIVIIIIITH